MMSTDIDTFIAEQIAAQPIEAKIVRKIVKALKAAGDPIVSVWDGEEEIPVSTLDEINRYVFDLVEPRLYTKTGSWVFLVMGQEYEMISDYTINLEDALRPVNDWIEARW